MPQDRFKDVTYAKFVCDLKQVHLSMPGYIEKALQRFDHTRPRRLQNSPHQHVIPTYGAKAQYAEPDPPRTLLNKEGQKYIQAVTGTLLYYSRAVDPTMLVALNAIATHFAYAKDNGSSQAAFRLLCESRRSNNNLPCQRHGVGHPQ